MENEASGKGSAKFPFVIDRRLRDGVEKQFTDGLRAAIVSGRYKPGEVLPSIVEFAQGLGVSIRAPQAALKALAKEGLVSPRRRTGTVVAGRRAHDFLGQVLLVGASRMPIYYDAVVEARVSETLAAAGYLVTRVVTPLRRKDPDGDDDILDLRQLMAALRRGTGLAVVIGSKRRIEAAVAEAGVPFALIGGTPPVAPGCVAFALSGTDTALPAVMAHLGGVRPRRLLQIATRRAALLEEEALSSVCGAVESAVIWPNERRESLREDFVRAGFDAMRRRLSSPGEAPDAYLFTDDYLARGALTALLAAGVRTGRDALFITLANRGISPVHPDPVDLLLRDPARDASAFAAAILDFLDNDVKRGTITLPIRLVRASTNKTTGATESSRPVVGGRG